MGRDMKNNFTLRLANSIGQHHASRLRFLTVVGDKIDHNEIVLGLMKKVINMCKY